MNFRADLFVPVLCAWRESRSVPDAYVHVYHCMKNRAEDKFNRWPKTLTEVCLQRWQFSSFNFNDPQVGLFPTPSQGLGWKRFQSAIDAAAQVFEGGTPDPTAGANHYFDNSILPPAAAWLGPGKTAEDLAKYFTVEVGPFKFYNIPPRR